LREDIPKEVIKPEYRRRKGANYLITDRPEWMNLKPVYKFINKALAEGGKRYTVLENPQVANSQSKGLN